MASAIYNLFVLFVLNLFSIVLAHDFVFLSPAVSFIDQHIAVALELLRRGHSLLVVTDDRFHHRVRLHLFPEELPRMNDRFRILSIGESDAYQQFKSLVVQPNSSKQAMKVYNDLFKRLVDLLESNQTNQFVLEAQRRVLSGDSFVVISAPFESPTTFCQRHRLPYAFLLPSPTFLSLWRTPIHDERGTLAEPPLIRWKLLFRALRSAFFPSANSLVNPAHIHRKPALRLVQTIPSAVPPQTHSPLTVFTGPISSKRRMDLGVLSPSLQAVLNLGNPVVYLSLGSYASMSQQQLTKLAAAFYPEIDDAWQLVWALSSEQSERLPDALRNASGVHIEQWIETPAVLNHPSVLLFISHCGANGLNEALLAGVPILGLPLFGDQPANCKAAEKVMRMAQCFRLGKQTASELRAAAKFLMADSDVRRAATQARTLGTTAYKGAATAADWLETVAGLKDDISSLAAPVDLYGAVNAYCLDLLIYGIIATFFIGFVVGRRFRQPRLRHPKAI